MAPRLPIKKSQHIRNYNQSLFNLKFNSIVESKKSPDQSYLSTTGNSGENSKRNSKDNFIVDMSDESSSIKNNLKICDYKYNSSTNVRKSVV